MLQRVDVHIMACLDRAREADERAAQIDDPKKKDEYSEMAARWRVLARSYQYVESLERFLLDAHKARDAQPPGLPPVTRGATMSQEAEPLPRPSTPPCPRCGKSMRLRSAGPATPYPNVSEVRYLCDCGESASALMVHND